MRPSLLFIFANLFSLAVSGGAGAWGREGHEVVGWLAEEALTQTVRAEVRALLADEPDPTLAGVSTWADTVRDSPDWRHTSRWHWVNLPREQPCSYVPERDCPQGNCVVGAIAAQLAVLADRSRPDTERAIALKLLVHFVGDIHQPFHAGFGEDRGGNLTQVRWLQAGWNVHALWDSAVVKVAGLAPIDYAAQLRGTAPLPPDRSLLMEDPAAEWALESCRAIINNALYPERGRVTRSYMDRVRPLAEHRLRQAGSRLAALLNAALPPTESMR